MAVFYQGDSLKMIQRYIADKSVNLIYINPPFGTTKQHWDEKMDWAALFKEFYRILKDNGMIVIHCSVPFNYTLIRVKEPLYSWYWKKENISNSLIAKVQPLRNTEEILVWKNKKTTYYPQRFGSELRIISSNGKNDYCSLAGYVNRTNKDVIGRTQTHHIEMSRNIDGFSTRPIELIELMIKSYTIVGDTVLDATCYMGLSGVVASSLGRKWIGIDKHFLPTKLFS